MKKRFGLLCASLFLVLALAMIFLPGLITEANAAAPSSITVNGKTLTSGQYLVGSSVTATKPSSGGYFYYYNGTLTVYNISGMTCDRSKKAVEADGDLTIDILGSSTITGNGTQVIKVTGNLKFTGTGNLTLNNTAYNVISTDGNLEFANTGTMTINGSGSAAAYCNGAITIGGKLKVITTDSMGLFSANSITVNSGTVDITGGSYASYAAIQSRDGGININGGTVTVNGDGNGIVTKNAFVQRGGKVKITAKKDGILVNDTSANAVVYAGDLYVTAAMDGVEANAFYINGGNATIMSTNTSYDSSYCAVKATNGLVKKSHITAKGSTLSDGSGAKDIIAANLGTYDNVQCWATIQINGYSVSDGMYFQFASASVSSSKPSSGGYAFYQNNTLTLHNYTGTSSTTGIIHNYDLTIVLDSGTSNNITTSTSDSTCKGIYVQGALTINGSGSLTINQGVYAVHSTGNLTVNSSTLDCRSSGLYAGGNMTLTNAKITVGQMGTLTAKKHVIHAVGSISINGSSTQITVNSPNAVYYNGSYVSALALYGKGITISAGNIDVVCTEGIESSADLTITGGNTTVIAGTGVVAKNITVSSGYLNVKGTTNGIEATKLTVNSGNVYASSTNTQYDTTYGAIKVSSPYSSNFVVGSNLAVIGNLDSKAAGSTAVNVSNLPDYDYIRIGNFIMLHEVVVPNGYYMESGNSVTTVSKTRPSSEKYAYYSNGVLTLNNYTYSGSSVGIRTFADTRINLAGGSEVNHIISHSGDLTFQGSGVLEIDTNLGTDAINSKGDVSINNGRITINSDNGGIYCNDFSLKNAFVWLTANYNGIDFNSKFTVQSGAITIKSTNTSGDASYRAINSRVSGPTININGLNHMVGGTSAPDIKSYTGFTSNDYDFVALGECILVRGVVLYKGCYLFNGDSQQYQNVGSHTEYAYLKDKNTLELRGYQYSGSAHGIASNIDLTIVLYDEENSIEAKGNYKGIYCNANLTVSGGTNYNDGITVKSDNGFGIYAQNKFTISSGNVIATSSNYYPVSVGEFIMNQGGKLKATCTYSGSTYDYAALAAGSATINGGRVDLIAAPNRGAALEVDNNLVIKAGTVILDSPAGDGISVSDGTVTIQGGDIDITAGGDGIYLYNGSYLSVQGGDVTVDAAQNGVWLEVGRLNMNGGFLSLGSTDLDNDSSYRALRLRGTSSDYYNVASSLSQSANSAYTTEVMDKLNPSNLSSYDRILIGDFVIVGGRVVKSGYSYTGTDVYSGNKGVGSAYYVNGILTLDQCRNVVSNSRGIQAYSDLTVQVAGESESFITVTSNRYAMAVYGDLTLTGSQKLQLSSATNPVYVEGNMTLAGSDLTLNATGNARSLDINGNLNVNSGRLETYNSNETGIYVTGNMTMTGGSVYVSGKKNGIHLPNGKLTVTGGYLQAISTDTTNDNTYAALKLAGTTSSYYNVSESLEQRANKSASTDIDVMTTIDPEELSAYDSVIIGQYISINGEILRSGETMSIGDGSASYVANSEGETLTLSNVDLTVNRSAAISTARSLTLILRGENILECNNSGRTIDIGGDLKIDGTGSLTATNYYNPLYCGGDVELTNATVTLNSKTDYALYLSNGGTLTVNSGNLTASTQSSSKTYSAAKGVDKVVLGLNRGLFGSASSDGSDLKGVTAADLKNCKYMTVGTCAHKDATTDFDHDCDLCGVKNVTAHSYKETVYHNTLHWDICNCGAQIGTASEHTFENGVCSCGMKAPDPVLEVLYESWEAKQGQPLAVYCSATVPGSPTLSYQWYRSASGTLDDLIPISGTNANGTTATLTVDTNTPGTYYVFCEVVTSYGGSAYTNPIKINIIPADTGISVSGTITSFGNTTDVITVELWKDGATSATYSTTTKGNSAGYSIPNVAPGTYTMKVMKAYHLPVEATIVVTEDTVADVELVLGNNGKQFKFNSAYLNLTQDINVVYITTIPEGFTNPYVVFEINGKSVTVTNYTIDNQGRYCFKFQGVNPHWMGDNIRSTLYATVGGTQVSYVHASYSVKQYCKSQLSKTTDNALKALLSDLLVYGEKTQLYQGYKTNELVTAGLTLYPSTFQTLGAEYNKQTITGTKNPSIDFGGAGLYLSNNAAIRYTITTSEPTKYTYEITIKGKTRTFTGEDLKYVEDGKYYLFFDGIMATEFDEVVTARIFENGIQVGRTVEYSVNTYIQKYQNDQSTLGPMLRALYNYGNSATNYDAE